MADKSHNIQKVNAVNQIENKNKENKENKERAVNPLAMRPDGVHVTIQETPPAINIIKRLFGF